MCKWIPLPRCICCSGLAYNCSPQYPVPVSTPDRGLKRGVKPPPNSRFGNNHGFTHCDCTGGLAPLGLLGFYASATEVAPAERL